MIENHHLAGILAGSLISVLCLTYVVLRRELIVRVLAGGDHSLPEAAATVLAFGAAAFVGPVLGIVAASVFDRMDSEPQYVLVAFGLATLMSANALASKTSLLGEKIVLNYALAVALGILMPRLIAG
jgi:hypothetical protein